MTTCTKNNIVIETACVEDLAGINDIRNEFSSETSNGYNLRKLNEDEISQMDFQETLVSKINNHVVGFVRYYKDTIFPNFNSDWIAEIYISKKYRNTGVGGQLFRSMLNRLVNNSNAKRIVLGVLSNNLGAIKFAKKHGFSFFSKNGEGEFWCNTLNK